LWLFKKEEASSFNGRFNIKNIPGSLARRMPTRMSAPFSGVGELTRPARFL
jgi:hypothetical protein